MNRLRSLAIAGIVTALAGAGFAQSTSEAAIGARQSLMKLQAFSAGQLFQMAQGKIPYDAAQAKIAADNLASVTAYDVAPLFPKGSDNASDPKTYALPAIWQNQEDFLAKYADLHKAALAAQAVAGNGADALKGAMGGIGGACGACHKAYRAPIQ